MRHYEWPVLVEQSLSAYRVKLHRAAVGVAGDEQAGSVVLSDVQMRAGSACSDPGATGSLALKT